MKITSSFLLFALISISIVFASAVLASKSDIPKDAPNECQGYYGDGVCDDSAEACGNDYAPSLSLAACKECSTGGFNCNVTASGIPAKCEAYGASTDTYCDDSPENCASGYKPGSVAECKECSTGKWKDCKSGSNIIPVTSSVSKYLFSGYSGICYNVSVFVSGYGGCNPVEVWIKSAEFTCANICNVTSGKCGLAYVNVTSSKECIQ